MKSQMSTFTKYLTVVRDYVFFGFLGGPKIIPLRYSVNFFKATTGIYVIFLMYFFNNFSSALYTYLFLHGTYGLAWIAKDIIFPDSTFQTKAAFGSHLLVAITLSLYWCLPITIAAGYGVQQISQARKWISISMYLIGVFLMLCSDYQKTSTLAKRKGLISTGFFARTRNPNYLGQSLLYFSFAVCTGHWISYAILTTIQILLFGTNMYLKDKLSYQKKDGWDEYRKKSYMFLPKIFPTDIINYLFYVLLASSLFYVYQQQQSVVMDSNL